MMFVWMRREFESNLRHFHLAHVPFGSLSYKQATIHIGSSCACSSAVKVVLSNWSWPIKSMCGQLAGANHTTVWGCRHCHVMAKQHPPFPESNTRGLGLFLKPIFIGVCCAHSAASVPRSFRLPKQIVRRNLPVENAGSLSTNDIQWLFIFTHKRSVVTKFKVECIVQWLHGRVEDRGCWTLGRRSGYVFNQCI